MNLSSGIAARAATSRSLGVRRSTSSPRTRAGIRTFPQRARQPPARRDAALPSEPSRTSGRAARRPAGLKPPAMTLPASRKPSADPSSSLPEADAVASAYGARGPERAAWAAPARAPTRVATPPRRVSPLSSALSAAHHRGHDYREGTPQPARARLFAIRSTRKDNPQLCAVQPLS